MKEKLSELELLTEDGSAVSAVSILPNGQDERFSLLVFLRNFAQLQVQAYQPLASVFRENGTRLIFISTSTAEQTQEFIEKAATKIPGELYGDPSTAIHRFFQLKRGVWRSVGKPLWSGLKKYGFRGIVEGFRLGYESSHLAGDSWQQGGVVLLDEQAKILFQHSEEHPADWADLECVFKQIGVKDVSVDYKAAVDEWMALRDKQKQDKK